MTDRQKDKVGQIMLWLSKDISHLYITKLLKLLYLIDEHAVRKIGVPITWLTYKVWKYGPVPPTIYNDLTFESGTLFKSYILAKEELDSEEQRSQLRILPNGEFNKEIFSQSEIDIIETVLKKYGEESAKDLVKLLHQEGTLWHKIYEEKKLEEQFKHADYNTTPYDIDLSVLLSDNKEKLSLYHNMEEFLAFEEAIKAPQYANQ